MRQRSIERGERVHLRHPRPDDVDAFIAAVRASRSLHRPWAQLPDSPAAFATLVERQELPSEEVYLICLNEDGALVGMANLGQIFFGHLRGAYLGYSAFVPHDGRGLMSEGVRLVLRQAFGPIGLHRVEANVQPENTRSIALVERLGFRREGYSPKYLKIAGRWRDHVRYAILAEEFFAAERERGTR
ncbi:MAG TPA: GNAT family protein [Actinomycetota bacterium]|nr:GNAT family protein [Actinomycetota bacterium]